MAPNLRRAGIDVTFAEVGHEKRKVWTLCKVQERTARTARTANESTDFGAGAPDPGDRPRVNARKENGNDAAGDAGDEIPPSAADPFGTGGWL